MKKKLFRAVLKPIEVNSLKGNPSVMAAIKSPGLLWREDWLHAAWLFFCSLNGDAA